MRLMDEIFQEIKSLGKIAEFKKLPTIRERYLAIDEAVMRANISKTPLSDFTQDEQLYISYLFQEREVDVGLCPYFYIFFSKRNQKFHFVCRATEAKERTHCRGRTEKCDKTT